MGSYSPFYAYPSAPPVVRAVPDPPRLHWGWVLLLWMITFGIFGSVWLIVQANWVRKVGGHSRTLPWAIVYASILPVLFLFAIFLGVLGVLLHLQNVQAIVAMAANWSRIAMLLLWILTVYMLGNELNEDPIDIPLNNVMIFFFGPVYFQYHLYNYKVSDAVHQFRGPLRTDLESTPEVQCRKPKAWAPVQLHFL
jgi:preprotein translocase subunit SecY